VQKQDLRENLVLDHPVRRRLIEMLPRLLRFARVLCRPPLEPDDLLQATCERALSRGAQFIEGTRFDSWTFAIMHSIWKNDLRRRALDVRAMDAVAHSAAPMVDGERSALGKIFLGDVLSALKRLPEDQAVVIMLVHIEGLSYASAADTLSIPIGTLESRIARGRIALGRLLDEPKNENRRSSIG
jgi:RNA polymerase sigma-70 factor, ECF subfamily